MNILILATMKGAVNYHRLVIPHINLKKIKPNIQILQGVDQMQLINNEMLKNIDIAVFTRCIYYENLEKVAMLIKSHKVKIVVDIDDYWKLDDHHILKPYFGVEHEKQTELSLRVADLIITTNKRLRDKVRPFNKRVEIIPNCIDRSDISWKSSGIKDKGKLKVAYFGGQTHREDLQSTGLDFIKLGIDCFVPEFKDFMPVKKSADEWTYGNLYDKYDVLIAPIIQTPFNSCKSNLKVIEAAAKGKAIICSKIPPYLDHQEGVIYIEKDWATELPKILKDRQYIKEMAAKLQSSVAEKYNITDWAKYRLNLYNRLLGR